MKQEADTLKRVHFELGGKNPVIVFADADLERAADSAVFMIAQEEIFGPVLTAIPFTDEAEALSIANDVQYGLTGYLWTSDVTRAFRFTDQLEAEMIWVNSENVRHLPTPFGVVKNSGIGRDGGDWSFDFYMETKNVAFATTPHAIQKLGG